MLAPQSAFTSRVVPTPNGRGEVQRTSWRIRHQWRASSAVGFVDVPGHERFVKNMLAGVGAVDVAMFVVAAGEGWKPQSEEHFRILELLGVRHGVVAITKADTVDAELLELTRLDVADHLAGSLLEDAPLVVCDSVTRSWARRRPDRARHRPRRGRTTRRP